MVFYYRSYPYSTKATMISVLANIGGYLAGIGAVVAVAMIENLVSHFVLSWQHLHSFFSSMSAESLPTSLQRSGQRKTSRPKPELLSSM
jgi:hypothetical protein